MNIKILGFAILAMFTLSPMGVRAGSLFSQERVIKDNLNSQQILLSQDAEKEPPIGERLKVAGFSESEVKTFLGKIQKAVAQNDTTALSKMIRYPIRLKMPTGSNVKISNSKQFITNYPKFITPNWKKTVLQQKYEELFVNAEGVMIGNGEIWFSGICKNQSCTKREIKIIGINRVE